MGFDKTEVPLTVAEYFGFPSRYHLLHYSILNIVKKSKYKTGHQGACVKVIVGQMDFF